MTPDYRMSADLQFNTACVAVIAMALIILGVWAIVANIIADDRDAAEVAGIDALADDYFTGRDQHANDDRAAMLALRGGRS